MERHHLPDLLARLDLTKRGYTEIQRSADLSTGIYVLPAGAIDPQQPHGEDEVYHVVAGRARVEVAGEVQDATPGTVVFVPARAPHRFLDIRETLVALVVFGPAEHARARGAGPRDAVLRS